MYKFLTKHGQTAALLLGLAVVAIFLITVLTGLSGAGYEMSTDLNALPDEAKAEIGFFNPGIGLTVALAIVTAFLAFVVFGVWDLIKFPKSAIKFLIGLVVLVIIFLVLYFTADPSVRPGFEDKMMENEITDNVSKFISAGLVTTVGLLGIAFIVAIAAEIRNAFK